MQEFPKFNAFTNPGLKINPKAYQSPMYPFVGQSSMLPAPPAIFHDGALPIMSIYELHHPQAYTPTSPYGLPYIYNPYHGLNLPYNYLHHPFATNLMTSLSANEMAKEQYIGNPQTFRNQVLDQKDIKKKSNIDFETSKTMNSGRRLF